MLRPLSSNGGKKKGVGATEGVPSLYSEATPRLNGHLRGRDASCDYLKACFLDGSPGRNLLEAEEGVESAAGWEHRLLGHLLPRTHTHAAKESSLCLLFIFISLLCILNHPGTGLKKQKRCPEKKRKRPTEKRVMNESAFPRSGAASL